MNYFIILFVQAAAFKKCYFNVCNQAGNPGKYRGRRGRMGTALVYEHVEEAAVLEQQKGRGSKYNRVMAWAGPYGLWQFILNIRSRLVGP
ncbi:hypothetical protein Q1695_010769 [Nippostrongylus brasiliensis]|nr:hypothetical protein Q1695_010769 [Nippostrongylus brasiliensis]